MFYSTFHPLKCLTHSKHSINLITDNSDTNIAYVLPVVS